MKVKGENLKLLFAEKGITRNSVEDAGIMTKFHAGRICKPGIHSIRDLSAKQLAVFTGLSLIDFKVFCMSDHPEECLRKLIRPATGLTRSEEEWLSLYRSMSPLDQAKARIALEEMLNRSSS